MKLEVVTFTGADDSIRPMELVPLSQAFPFVEWGILLSAQSTESSRYPSGSFLAMLNQIKKHHCPEMKLAGHICGSWMQRLLTGDSNILNMHTMIGMFDRIQLNFNSLPLSPRANKSHWYGFGLLMSYFIFHNCKKIVILESATSKVLREYFFKYQEKIVGSKIVQRQINQN